MIIVTLLHLASRNDSNLCIGYLQASCEDKERKLQKEMLKGPKEPAVTQEKLRQTTQAKELADIEGTMFIAFFAVL